MSIAFDLVSKGFFPKELPPVFSSQSFGSILQANLATLPRGFQDQKLIGKTLNFSLARTGSLRRKLGIPNPIKYYNLAQIIETQWSLVQTTINRAQQSKSKPKAHLKRAFQPEKRLGDLPRVRIRHRTASKYLLKADISAFYSSIYTHAIPWAIHTKAISKQNINRLDGDKIDQRMRNCQDKQTKGIPIGPDASLIVSEILLSAIDEKIEKSFPGVKGFRYMDDFEYSFPSTLEAEGFLNFLQEALGEFELDLHPQKTQIVELPQPTEKPWVPFIREFSFNTSSKERQARDIVAFFDRSFEHSQSNKEESVISYSLTRIREVTLKDANLPLLNDYVLQAAISEPGSLQRALAIFHDQMRAQKAIPTSSIEELLNLQIVREGNHGHNSEICWALWGIIAFGVKIHEKAIQILENSEDPLSAIIALDAQSKGLLDRPLNTRNWLIHMNPDSLMEEAWLLSYEANINQWLPSQTGTDHVSADPNFGYLKSQGLKFYVGVDNSKRLDLGLEMSY